MPINWQHPKVFHTTVSPVTTDIDGLGHTNNRVYSKWCEQAAWQHSESLGVSLADYQSQDRAMAIISAQYDYLAATYQGEILELATGLSHCDGKMRLQRHFRIIRPSDNTLIFQGSWKFMCIEISSGKPKRMPPQFKAIYGPACIG